MRKPGLNLCALSRRFFRDRRGVASIFGVMVILTGFGFSVMVLDIGHLYLEKRRLQSAVDAAALAAAGDPTNASAIVTRVLTARGYGTAATVATGAYSADSTIPMNDRLDTDPAAQKNAVRVNETVTTPSVLARMVGGAPQSTISASATAAQIPVVSFSAGTGLAGLSGGAINTVLGGLLGTSLNLSLANYQALANVNVDALTFLDQLAAQAGVSAGTYGDLANTNVTMSQLATAITAALNIHPDGNDSAAIDALNLLSLATPGSVTAPVGRILDTTVWQKREVGSVAEQTPGQVAFNLYDLASGMGRAYGGQHLVNLGSTLTVPVAGVTLGTRMALGAPMTSIAAATVGTSITTAQTRLAIAAAKPGLSLLGNIVTVSLPIYLDIAPGTATVAAIPCQTGGTMATISAVPQAATAQMGSVTDSDLADFSKNPTVSPAVVSLTLPILGTIAVNISGSYPVMSGPAQPLDFTQANIDSGTVKEASGAHPDAIFSGLGSQTNVTIALGGAVSGGALKALVQPLLAGILSNLDLPTDLLLRTLGLRLGIMDVSVQGVRCGTPTLVT